MYLKKIKSKNHTYLKIVSSYREDGKIKHKVIANLGRLDKLEEAGFKSVVDGLHRLFKSDEYVNINSINKDGSDILNYGWIFYKKIWDKYDLDSFFDDLQKEFKIEYDLKHIILSLVINRAVKPSSKLKYFNNKDSFANLNNDLELHHIYRALDVIASKKEDIESYMFNKSKNLFNRDISITFYDVTTFYFESKNENELKDFGFSKDNKVNEVQIVMGLLIDKDGIPIGYELFKGNTFDSKTMLKILAKLKNQFKIENITIVADRGLNSKLNFKEIKEAGFDYIVSAKIKSMNKTIQNDILNGENYIQINNSSDDNYYYGYKTIEYLNSVKYKDEELSNRDGKNRYSTLNLEENLICTYSEKRAKKDRSDRERLVEKAKDIINNNKKSSIIAQKGHKKYVKKTNKNDENEKCEDFNMSLDLAKIKEEEKFDGYYAIHTSNKNLSPIEVIENYHNLYKIEDSFRVLKSTFNTRPIYHYKAERIEGHFIVCFIAFFLERHLEYRLKNNKKSKDLVTDANNIKDAINSINFIKTDIEEKYCYLKSNYNQLASIMFDIFKIKQPKQLNFEDELETYG